MCKVSRINIDDNWSKSRHKFILVFFSGARISLDPHPREMPATGDSGKISTPKWLVKLEDTCVQVCAKFGGRTANTRSSVGAQSRPQIKGAIAQLPDFARFSLTKPAFGCVSFDACGRVVRGAINVGGVSKYVGMVCAHDGANQSAVSSPTAEHQRVEVG